MNNDLQINLNKYIFQGKSFEKREEKTIKKDCWRDVKL